MLAHEYLVEIGAFDGFDETTLRFSTCGYVTGPGDEPANTLYERRVVDPGRFEVSLFAPGRTMGLADSGAGDMVLGNVDGGLDDLIDPDGDWALSGRAVVVKRLAAPNAAFSTAEVVFRAKVEGLQVSSSQTEVSLRLYDPRLTLDVPLQANRYGGTTTSGGLEDHLADGTADMKDQVKPLCYGTCLHVPVVWVNPFDLIAQVHDGAVASIQVYDSGVALTDAGDHDTVAELQAATLVPGQFATCLASGLYRLGGTPAGEVTADVVEGATLADRCAAKVVERMLAKIGVTDLDATSFTALASAAPEEVGIFVGDDRRALGEISAVLGSIGGTLFQNAAGDFEVGRIAAPGTSAWDITETMVMADDFAIEFNTDTEEGLPVWQIILLYERLWQVHSASGIGTYLDADTKAYLTTEWRRTKASDTGIADEHLLAPEMEIETLLVDADDAATEVARRFALYSVPRHTIRLPIPAADAGDMLLGSTGTVTYPRNGYADGRKMVVIGRDEVLRDDLVVLTLWG